MKTKLHLSLAGILLSGILSAAPLTLSENGKTDFVLVSVQNATAMEQLAYRELQAYLKKSTGADFRQTGKNHVRSTPAYGKTEKLPRTLFRKVPFPLSNSGSSELILQGC